MRILFCSEPFSSHLPDSSFENEAQAAREAGFASDLLDFEKLVRGDADGALRRVCADESAVAIYRGWMLRPRIYEQLFHALQKRKVTLINSPEAYRHCHFLPESYDVIAERTPLSVWLPLPDCLDMDRVLAKLSVFGSKPLILKDYVKSRKHEWNEACLIPSACDRAGVERVVKRFVELQGDEINEGLVFREYVSLQGIGVHSKSAMPLTKEFRLFFFDAQLLYASKYWTEGAYDEDVPPIEQFQNIARRVRSRFFTMDVAQRTDGTWIIVELGDGQVAGLPGQDDASRFYQTLASQTSNL